MFTFTPSMKGILKNVSILLLAITVLLSSSGVTVFKMVCCKKNRMEISLEQFKSCCKHKEKAGTNFSKKCCSYATQTFKLEQLCKPYFACFSIAPLHYSLITHPSSSLSCLSIRRFFVSDSSPPLSGKQILISISSFLI